MEIIKIILIAIVGALVFIYLKLNSSELSGLVVVATGILIIILTVDYIVAVVDFFKQMSENTGVDGNVFKIIVKIYVF